MWKDRGEKHSLEEDYVNLSQHKGQACFSNVSEIGWSVWGFPESPVFSHLLLYALTGKGKFHLPVKSSSFPCQRIPPLSSYDYANI